MSITETPKSYAHDPLFDVLAEIAREIKMQGGGDLPTVGLFAEYSDALYALHSLRSLVMRGCIDGNRTAIRAGAIQLAAAAARFAMEV